MTTVFTDAAHCAKGNVAAYGAWAIGEGLEQSKFFGGVLPRGLSNANEAEITAIAAALETVELGGIVVLQSDSMAALQAVLRLDGVRWAKAASTFDVSYAPARKTVSPAERRALQRIAKAIAGKKMFLRHVKGHLGNVEGRHWVNRKCDAIATRYLAEARASAVKRGHPVTTE